VLMRSATTPKLLGQVLSMRSVDPAEEVRQAVDGIAVNT
jgi:hypothetical protein